MTHHLALHILSNFTSTNDSKIFTLPGTLTPKRPKLHSLSVTTFYLEGISEKQKTSPNIEEHSSGARIFEFLMSCILKKLYTT